MKKNSAEMMTRTEEDEGVEERENKWDGDSGRDVGYDGDCGGGTELCKQGGDRLPLLKGAVRLNRLPQILAGLGWELLASLLMLLMKGEEEVDGGLLQVKGEEVLKSPNQF